MQIAHKIELKANNTQETYFKKACGISRFTWNWALGKWNERYTAGLKSSGMDLKKQFNAIKEAEYPWTYEVTKYASQQPFLDLQDAFSRFFKKLGGKPKFKKRENPMILFISLGTRLNETKRRGGSRYPI